MDLPVKEFQKLLTNGWFFPGSLFWFALGLVAGLRQDLLKKITHQRELMWSVIMVLVLILGVFEWEFLLQRSGREWLPPTFTAVDALFCTSFLMAFFAARDKLLISQKRLGWVGGKAYGIYLTHTLVLVLFARGVYHIAPGLLAYALVFVTFLTFFGLAIPMSLMEIVKKTPLSRMYGYLFG